jgi:hypothetical protein
VSGLVEGVVDGDGVGLGVGTDVDASPTTVPVPEFVPVLGVPVPVVGAGVAVEPVGAVVGIGVGDGSCAARTTISYPNAPGTEAINFCGPPWLSASTISSPAPIVFDPNCPVPSIFQYKVTSTALGFFTFQITVLLSLSFKTEVINSLGSVAPTCPFMSPVTSFHSPPASRLQRIRGRASLNLPEMFRSYLAESWGRGSSIICRPAAYVPLL